MRVSALLACSLVLSLAAGSALSAPRICKVSDFDTSGCKSGDHLLFMPQHWGNEQLPIEFAGKKCDFNKPVVWNNSGVTGVYAGDKRYVDGHQEKLVHLFSPRYHEIEKNPQGWVKMRDDTYWRVSSAGSGRLVQIGDKVILSHKLASFNEEGQEILPEKYTPEGAIDAITKDHYLYQVEPTYGSVVEIVGLDYHGFLLVEPDQKNAPAKPKAKK